MEDKKEPTPPPILEQLKEYVETRLKLAKLQAIESGSSIAAGLVADAVIVLSMVLAFLFASITLAYYLGGVLNTTWAGFGCVAILYLIIALAIKYNRKKIEKPIANSIIQKIFKN